MINEIKVDNTKPVWAEVWDDLKDRDRRTRIYLFSIMGIHYCVYSGFEDRFLQGDTYRITEWKYIELPKVKKTIPLDAKTCPRRPVVTHPEWTEGAEFYPHIGEDELDFGNGNYISWSTLKDEGYLINGLPASREVEE